MESTDSQSHSATFSSSLSSEIVGEIFSHVLIACLWNSLQSAEDAMRQSFPLASFRQRSKEGRLSATGSSTVGERAFCKVKSAPIL